MLELASTRLSVVGCFAAPEALDGLAVEGAMACRVAPDEAMVVGEPGAGARLVKAASARLGAADPEALVLDTTAGWTAWALAGDAEDVRDACARLSALRLGGEGYVQGDVAGVPVRAIARPGRVHLLVAAMWDAYLLERILDRCRALGLREREQAADWAPSEESRA